MQFYPENNTDDADLWSRFGLVMMRLSGKSRGIIIKVILATITNWAATAGSDYRANNEAALSTHTTRANNAPEYNTTAYDPAKSGGGLVYLGEVCKKRLFTVCFRQLLRNQKCVVVHTVPTIFR